MHALIKVNHHNDRQTTSARDLWEFLDKPHGEFMKWFSRYSEYGFTENVDYRVIDKLVENPHGGRPATDYEITIEMAKELAMLQKTEKGKQARLYFIDLEKKWNSPEAVMSRALKMANDHLVELQRSTEALLLENTMKDQIINELQPKATYYDLILQSKAALSVSQIAKDYGLSATKLNELLHDLKVQYKQGGVWLLYQDIANKGYTSSKTHNYINDKTGEHCSKLHTYWTQKGRLFIYDLLKNKKDLVPQMERGC